MRLEGPDGTLLCIAEMNIWGHELESRFPCLCNDLAILLACLVIKDL